MKSGRPTALLCFLAALLCFLAARTCLRGITATSFDITPRIEGQDASKCGSPWSSECFDRSRCVGQDGSQSLTVYIHDGNCSNAKTEAMSEEGLPGIDWQCGKICNSFLNEALRLAHENKIVSETPEGACLIIYGLPARGHECVTKTPTWQGGLNHLIVSFADKSKYYYKDFHGPEIFAASNMQPPYFRYGHDISIPLPPSTEFSRFGSTSPMARKYFATFKGTLYLRDDGAVEREAVRQVGLHASSSDVVVFENCHEKHKYHLLAEFLELCQDLHEKYIEQDFGDLMNTTFAFIPSGRSPATYRLGEALSAGAIPVFIHASYVKPFPDRIPWHLCSFSFHVDQAPDVVKNLRAVPEEKLVAMQSVALGVYEDFFKGGIDAIVKTAFDILEERLAFHWERP